MTNDAWFRKGIRSWGNSRLRLKGSSWDRLQGQESKKMREIGQEESLINAGLVDVR